jgi:hypothetical protein
MTTETLVTDLWEPLPPLMRECHGLPGYPVPFLVSNHVYATDGRLACRVRDVAVNACSIPYRRAAEATNQTVREKIAGMFDAAHGADYPAHEIPAGRTETEPCSTCGGGGKVICNFECEHDCPKCEGAGAEKCFRAVAVGPRKFAEYYLAVLERHGCTSLRVPDTYGKPAAFVCGDIEGLLMTLKDDA